VTQIVRPTIPMTFVRSLLIIAGLCTEGGPRCAAELH
jgi:hypothetical protein